MKHLQILELAEKILNSKIADFNKHIDRARRLTYESFKNYRTIFNPIYISNICTSDCLYCGYRKTNTDAVRRTLTIDEMKQEAMFLKNRGIDSILLLAGEFNKEKYTKMLLDHILNLKCETKPKWLGVEVASLGIKEYNQLHDAGVNCVIIFQETYNINRYRELHRQGLKADYFYRLNTLNRAVYAGINEVGLGVLYGIGDYFSDTLAVIQHGLSLKSEFPDLKLRFSFPRIMDSDKQDEYSISELINENVLYRIIIAVRNCFPEASLVLTGRESTEFLLQCLDVIDIIGKGGSTTVGGYTLHQDDVKQFQLNTDTSLEDFLKKLTINYIIN